MRYGGVVGLWFGLLGGYLACLAVTRYGWSLPAARMVAVAFLVLYAIGMYRWTQSHADAERAGALYEPRP